MPTLPEISRRQLLRCPDGPLAVGFSGGSDSTALLDVLANLPQARQRGLRALHVHHGLHADADTWAEHCADFCRKRDIPLTVLAVDARPDGQGPEAAARDARMQAFAQQLRTGEALVLAHHRDDQVETIVLKLLRGAGPHGLAGMRCRRPFAAGWLWRPWLDVPKAQIESWLQDHRLEALSDPSNDDRDMTRSWLRHDILPQVRAHLPQSTASILHAGRLCADTRDYLDQQIAGLNHLVGADDSLDAGAWLALPDALRGLLLERWLHRRGCTTPSGAQRRELQRQVATAQPGRQPWVHWPGTDVRLWRGRLHAMAPLPPAPPDWNARWDGQALALPLGTLRLAADHGAPPTAKPCASLTVRLRRGGEYLHPAGDGCGRTLAYVFQKAQLPPWLRPYCPLIYADGELLAVAHLCFTARGRDYFAALGARPEWRYHV